jgi:sugar O-acyltransferase (sialic acid O-acetyltransferase NeuD family)
MKTLFVVGAGGFASEVLFVLERLIKNGSCIYDNIYLIDDSIEKGKINRHYEVVGNIDILNDALSNDEVVLTVNDPLVRDNIYDRVLKLNPDLQFPNIIDPSAIVDVSSLKIGIGNIIMHNVVLSTNIKIGNFNIFNSYTGIGHDSSIYNFNTFNPRVCISGNVNIGSMNTFGMNSSVLQGKKIGSKNEIWMNTTLGKSISDGAKYFGIPAKKVNL